MNKVIYTVLGLLVCTSFMYCQTEQSRVVRQPELNQATIAKISELEGYRGIKILDEGPAGSRHSNSKRGVFGCTKFRITIFNDTIVPIDLEIKFPSKPVYSLPDTLFKNQAWVLPDSLTPDTFQNAFNFGISGLEDYFNSDFTESRIVKTTIEPKGHYTFYTAMIGESPFGFGSNYSKLFINGQAVDVPYLEGKSVKMGHSDTGSLDLVFGIGHTPHNHYTLIPCGQINFLK